MVGKLWRRSMRVWHLSVALILDPCCGESKYAPTASSLDANSVGKVRFFSIRTWDLQIFLTFWCSNVQITGLNRAVWCCRTSIRCLGLY